MGSPIERQLPGTGTAVGPAMRSRGDGRRGLWQNPRGMQRPQPPRMFLLPRIQAEETWRFRQPPTLRRSAHRLQTTRSATGWDERTTGAAVPDSYRWLPDYRRL